LFDLCGQTSVGIGPSITEEDARHPYGIRV
jgi:hypothetical protein